MQLSKYPRPKNDTGIGFHYLPDTQHYDGESPQLISELQHMGASWLVVISDFPQGIPLSFLEALVSKDIEPIIHVRVKPIRPLEAKPLTDLLRGYASCGVHYVWFYNHPNLPTQWPLEEWARPDLVRRFMGLLLPSLERALEAGLYPVLTPLCPGGDYWDTAFLAQELDLIREQGKGYLFDRLSISIHNHSYNRPLPWGKGGQARWKDARPYCTPPSSEDHIGFYLFEWYDEIVHSRVGYSLPLICGQNGAFVGDAWDDRFPSLTETLHAERSREMCRLLMEGELPDYVFNHAFWLLAGGGHPAWEEQAWFKAVGSILPAVTRLKEMDKHPRSSRPDQAKGMAKASRHKPIYHYLLLPEEEMQGDGLKNYLYQFRPTCGFRLDEAVNAQYVTIIGGASKITLEEERMLRGNGCKVERIDARDNGETQRILDELAHTGRRFLNL